jgi:hypothetical protein
MKAKSSLYLNMSLQFNQISLRYWQNRLEATRGQIMPESSIVLAVHEDWVGGAGNALGTLYAVQKAAAKAVSQDIDLLQRLVDGASVALFHTAGKGTRLSPLPGSEINNKPGVKLPSIVQVMSCCRDHLKSDTFR